jgi:hypothetical protein
MFAGFWIIDATMRANIQLVNLPTLYPVNDPTDGNARNNQCDYFHDLCLLIHRHLVQM